MTKEAIALETVHRAMRNRALKSGFWNVVGKLRGVSPRMMPEFVNRRVRGKLGPQSMLNALRDPSKDVVRSAVGLRPQPEQNLRILEHLLNRRVADPVEQAPGLLGKLLRRPGRTLSELKLRPESQRIKMDLTQGGSTGRIHTPSGSAVDLTTPSPGLVDLGRATSGSKLDKSISLAKPLRTQVSEHLAKHPDELYQDIARRVRFASPGGTPDISPEVFDRILSQHLKAKQRQLAPGMGDMDKMLRRLGDVLPRWGGMTAYPGHPEVAGRYGLAGFKPSPTGLGADMPTFFRPGGKLPEGWQKGVESRFQKFLGATPKDVFSQSRDASLSQSKFNIMKALNEYSPSSRATVPDAYRKAQSAARRKKWLASGGRVPTARPGTFSSLDDIPAITPSRGKFVRHPAGSFAEENELGGRQFRKTLRRAMPKYLHMAEDTQLDDIVARPSRRLRAPIERYEEFNRLLDKPRLEVPLRELTMADVRRNAPLLAPEVASTLTGARHRAAPALSYLLQGTRPAPA
jgi:hypothetical protein